MRRVGFSHAPATTETSLLNPDAGHPAAHSAAATRLPVALCQSPDEQEQRDPAQRQHH